MRNYLYLLLGLLLLIFAGCSIIMPGGLVDSTAPIPQQKYEVLGEAEGSETSTTFLIFQFNKPNKDFIERATQKAVKKFDGDELINVTWYNKYTNYFLFSTYSFVVEGTVVKRSENLVQYSRNLQTILQKPEQVPPFFNNLGFNLSYSRGTNNGAKFYSNYYYNPYYYQDEYEEESISGFGGMRLNIFLKNRDKLYYFYPQISYGKISKDGKEKINLYGKEYEVKFKGYIKTIPITFNVGLNGSKIEQFSQNLPPGLNPYANFGLGYYITNFGDTWNWNEIGFNFGLGVEYQIQPKLSINFGFNRHSIFTGTRYTYWDWNVGLGYYFQK